MDFAFGEGEGVGFGFWSFTFRWFRDFFGGGGFQGFKFRVCWSMVQCKKRPDKP